MLIFLPASAGTGFVSAYFGTGTDDGLGYDISFNIEPPVPLFFKPGLFMMNLLKTILFISGLKLHDPFGILRTALGTGEDLQPQPPGLFTPVPGLFDIDLIFAVFAAGIHDIGNGVDYIGGIPTSHEGFRRGRDAGA
jgi:hypothetical protein